MSIDNQEHEIMSQEIEALLREYAVDDHARDVLAPLVALTSLRMNHLYADLGFENRVQMGRFMMENFPLLAQQKPQDKLWKKFLYDLIGKVAPACSECDDQQSCFKCILTEVAS